MLSEKGKSLTRKLLAATLFLSIVPDGKFYNDAGYASELVETFEKDGKLKVVIDFSNDMYYSGGLPGGFSYEMACNFAEYKHLPIEISLSEKKENWLDSLAQNKADIVIMKISDTLGCDKVLKSMTSDNHTIWAVNKERVVDMKQINSWMEEEMKTKRFMNMRNRFYSLYDPFKRLAREVRAPKLSPYDNLIRKHAAHLGWDWRLLAAIMYQESRFAINTHSSRGACGLMQVMPSTGAYYGFDDLLNPDNNIEAGCKHLNRLQKMFNNDEFLPDEKIRFTLAAYNAGEGRIADCRSLAKARNLDNTKWEDVVKIIPEMRLDSILNEDSVKLGRFRGTETINYIEKITAIYEAFCIIYPQ